MSMDGGALKQGRIKKKRGLDSDKESIKESFEHLGVHTHHPIISGLLSQYKEAFSDFKAPVRDFFAGLKLCKPVKPELYLFVIFHAGHCGCGEVSETTHIQNSLHLK